MRGRVHSNLSLGNCGPLPFRKLFLERSDDVQKRDDGQPFFLRLLAQWLEVLVDPDVSCLVDAEDSFAAGVSNVLL